MLKTKKSIINKKLFSSYKLFVCFIAGIFFINTCLAQDYKTHGYVYDFDTKEPLSFVNIVITSSNQGGISDIDGKFNILSQQKPDSLKLSFIGYETLVVELKKTQDLRLYMIKKNYELDEVIILPGINPAHRIIDSAIAHIKYNKPENYASFEFKAHNKVHFGIDAEHLSQKRKSDSINDVFLKKIHLLLIETITQRQYLYPNNNKERVLASKISGLRDPYLTFLASQLQTFSFYDDYINILDKKFINPLSKNTYNRYFFILEDTILAPPDSIFIISFHPKFNRNFDALKGLLYINTHKYAIQYVTATPADEHIGKFNIKIRQSYELVENNWFPSQLNTEMLVPYIDSTTLFINGRSYLTDISINKPLRKKDFNHIGFEITDNALSSNDSIWKKYRYEELTEKDLETYRIIDSLSKVHNLNRFSNWMQALTSGKVSYKIIDFDIGKILSFNNYNGWRIGSGIETNNNISKYFNLGGYLIYNCKNKDMSYGSHLHINIDKKNDLMLKYAYTHDDLESARINHFTFVESMPLNDYRAYIIDRTDFIQRHSISLMARPYKYLLTALSYNYSFLKPNFEYKYLDIKKDVNLVYSDFYFSEIIFNSRFAYKESFVLMNGIKQSLGTSYPIFNMTFTKGINDDFGNYSYSRLDFEIDKSFYIKMLGASRFIINAGIINGYVPYSKLYNGLGSYEPTFTLNTPYTFSTMRLTEFLSDRYMAIFYAHNFGTLLYQGTKFKPELVAITNYCIGSLSHQELHRNISFTTLEKGYWESGIIINNILSNAFYGIGLGAFYRYGYYKLNKTKDNFALQMSLKFNI